MRIVLTVPSLAREFGGPAGKARHLASALSANGCQVRVVGVGRPRGQDEVGLPRLATFHGTPLPGSLLPLNSLLHHAEAVHILGYRDPVGTAAGLHVRRAGVPYVLEPIGMHRPRLRSLRLKAAFDTTVGRLVIGGAARIVATSHLEAGELAVDGVDADRIVVRPNGVAVESLLPLLERGRIRDRLSIPDDVPLVLALGRIAAKKGLADVLRAVAPLDDVWVLVAGPDDGDGTLAALLALRERLGLTRRVAIEPDGLWGDDRARAMADADVFALPSATENFGTAAAEASCCGLPVVVSEACGVKEWLDPASTRVVAPADVVALRGALAALIDGRATRSRAEKAAPRLRELLSWNRIATDQVRMYEDVLADESVTGR